MNIGDSQFAGPPNVEVDLAWHKLLSSISIRVSASELLRNNQTSVELPGGGYMAWLEAFHQLHCVVSENGGQGLCNHRACE